MTRAEGKTEGQPSASKDNSTALHRRQTRSPGSSSVPSPPPAFYASHFRYSCTGAMRANSNRTGSIGSCLGYRGKTDLIGDWPYPMTRKEAISAFEEKIGLDDLAARDDTESTEALAYTQVPKMIVYDPPRMAPDVKPKTDQNTHLTPLTKATHSAIVSADGNVAEHDWKCYGQTYVDLLVLRPKGLEQSKERTVAVAPQNSVGYSVQRATLSDSHYHEVLRTVSLGGVKIVLTNTEHSDDGIGRNAGALEVPAAATNVDQPELTTVQKAAAPPPEKKAGIIDRMFASGGKILTHMERNAKILSDSVKDDYPRRTFQASQRIVQEMGKVPERTWYVAKLVAKKFFDDDDDDDNNNGRRK